MKIGITLPQFEDEADTAIEAARRAESLGIDGVFCFDHLWPMGQPGRPALSSAPLLGALAASTSTIAIGTLVARIGLLPDAVLLAVLSTLDRLSDGRFIAGIGTGDGKSRRENEAYGIPVDDAGLRREHLAAVATAAVQRGIPVWVGGGQPKTVALARTAGTAVNLWEGDAVQVAELAATGMEVTWGGPVEGAAPGVTARLLELAGAGATWAVCAWPASLETIAEAADELRRLTASPGP